MTCQQCGEPIVVRGPTRQATGQARPVGGAPLQAPAPAFAPQGAAAKNIGLAAELGRHVPPPPPPPEPAVPQEEWHVAINDAPVGPLRRDEVARRIAQGIIDRESLAWREGMDDWMQIKHIAELSALFAPPAPAPVAAPAHGMGGMNGGGASQQTLANAPTARADMAPIGGRKVVPVEPYEPAYEAPYEPPEPSEPPEVAVATVGPVVSQESASASRQPGWAQMFALVSGGAFILAAGALLGVRVLAPNNAQPAPAPAVAAVPAAPAAPAPAANEGSGEPEEPGDSAGSVIELDMQAIDGKAASARKASGSSSDSTNNDKKKSQLTAEQRAMLERMGGGLDQGPSNLRAPSEVSRAKTGQGAQLTAEQLSAVVLSGRKNLQRCYETALRGSNSTDTVRLDVEIQVSPNGNVTSVHTSGKGLPGMDDCITRTVKMWRFPKSGEATQTRFPVVFQPGG